MTGSDIQTTDRGIYLCSWTYKLLPISCSCLNSLEYFDWHNYNNITLSQTNILVISSIPRPGLSSFSINHVWLVNVFANRGPQI